MEEASLEVGKLVDDQAWKGFHPSIVREELRAARQLGRGHMNRVRQLESGLGPQVCGCHQHVAADRHHLQRRGELQDLDIGGLPLGMSIEQGFHQRFCQRQFTGDRHQFAAIQGAEQCCEYRTEGRIPLQGINEDVGIEVDASGKS